MMSEAVAFNQIFTTDVKMAEITVQSNTYVFDTATKVEMKPLLVEGKEQALDIKGIRRALRKAKNTYVGTEIKMTDNALNAELYALMMGGEITYNEDSETFKSYSAPNIGEEETKVAFKLSLYSEQLDETGKSLAFLKTTYDNCEGSLIGTSQEDEKFFAPEFVVTSRPSAGSPGFTIERVKALPKKTDSKPVAFDEMRGDSYSLKLAEDKTEVRKSKKEK